MLLYGFHSKYKDPDLSFSGFSGKLSWQTRSVVKERTNHFTSLGLDAKGEWNTQENPIPWHPYVVFFFFSLILSFQVRPGQAFYFCRKALFFSSRSGPLAALPQLPSRDILLRVALGSLTNTPPLRYRGVRLSLLGCCVLP